MYILYSKSVEKNFGKKFFCRGVDIWPIISSETIVDSSFNAYIPIFISLQLTSFSINLEKQRKKEKIGQANR